MIETKVPIEDGFFGFVLDQSYTDELDMSIASQTADGS